MESLKRKAHKHGYYPLPLHFSLYFFILFLCIILWCFGLSAVNARDISAPQKIFLDPGHGGKDFGAKGSTNSIEKVVTLEIAKYLKDILQRRLEIEVFLTRSGDYYLSSAERIALANNRKADLFISLHTGAHFNPHRQGFNIFYLQTDGIDMELPEQDSTDGMISWLRGQEDFIGPSQQLAQIIMKNLNKAFYMPPYGGRISGGPWAILIGARMPAVLIEIGHLTNPIEENRLKDKIYRQAIAEAISDGIDEYFSRGESD